MGNFKEDLKKGELMEERVIELLSSKGLNIIKNPNKKEMDLLIIEDGIEVKLDEYAKYSGNFYIEFECNEKPSGIFKEERVSLRWWAHSNGEELFLLRGENIRDWMKEVISACRDNKSNTSKGFRVVEQGGNGGRTKGVLVPVEKMREKADFIYNI